LSSAVGRFPAETSLRLALARASLASGHCALANKIFTEFFSSAAADYQLAMDLGRAKLCLGDLFGARTAFTQSLALHPNVLTWYFLGQVYQAQGNADAATDAYRHVLEMDSQFIEVRGLLAELFQAKQDHNEAWRQYRKMSYADPQNQALKKKTEQLSAKITKKPEEILPPKKLSSFTQITSSRVVEGLQVLRVGIGTGAGGLTAQREEAVFSVSAPFVVKNNGSVLATGGPQEIWRVRLSTAVRAIRLTAPTGKATMFSGTISIEPESSAATIMLRALTVAEGTTWGGVADRELRGRLELRADWERQTLIAVNVLALEEYLYGVLPAEMPWYYPLEALKAQAVLARTYAWRAIGKHSKQGYDVCDSQHCQVYEGVSAEKKNPTHAADSTRGKVLFYRGKPVEAVFSSNAGGVTASGRDAGWDDKPYWVSVTDIRDESHRPPSTPSALSAFLREEPKAFSSPSVYVHGPSYRWQRAVSPGIVGERLQRKKDIGKVESVAVLERCLSGRVAKVRISGSRGSITLEKENEIRKYLSAGLLRSIFFWSENVYAPDGSLQLLLFSGAGWGHGVGFCQAGSSGRAEEGQDYKQILQHYYPGSELSDISKKK
ncbi:MAG TPA: SpoIID/LytB domain-containing protein, partial [Elusimicrobiales bacterium]|nr:SpoIID/LytB domain-containing protein [Elusimicrobiales bacterium]